MKLVEVTTAQHAREFLQLPVRLYRDVPQWIRPLDEDIEKVFDPERNKTFRHGECTRWILQSESGETIGRVAAFIDQKSVHKRNAQPTGGMGFFECIDDRAAAFALFDQCRSFLSENGMEAMDGPINFGSRERWWGLLVEGFEFEPNYQCNYNFPYYKDMFEAYGFQVYFYQLTFARPIMRPISPKLQRKADLIKQDPDYEIRYVRKDELTLLPEYIMKVYNKAWANRGDVPEMSISQAKLIVRQMKPIMDLRLVWFAFYKSEPVGFFLSLPEINQIFKHVNGKLDWLGKLRFLWHTFRKTNRKAFGVLFGVVPEHQGKGVDGAMVNESRIFLQEVYRRYDQYEMNWIGDFNPKMINVVEQVGAEVNKRHATYRKLFDESKPFQRHPILH